MGMTIKKAKAIVNGITDKIDCNTVDIDDWAEFWGFTREEYEEFLDMSIKAVDALSKYQKIQEIARWNNAPSPYYKPDGQLFREIIEVLEDGKTE